MRCAEFLADSVAFQPYQYEMSTERAATCSPATHATPSMASIASFEGQTDSDHELFSQIDKYPWDTDEEFQNGLRAILGQQPAAAQAESLALRARCFYYSRQAFPLT